MKAILVIMAIASSFGFQQNDPVKGANESKTQTTKNLPPQAKAGNDLVLNLKGDIIQLDGTSSREPDGLISRYQWTQISGTPVVIENPQAAITALTLSSKGDYVFRLTVMDEKGGVSTDDVKLTIN